MPGIQARFGAAALQPAERGAGLRQAVLLQANHTAVAAAKAAGQRQRQRRQPQMPPLQQRQREQRTAQPVRLSGSYLPSSGEFWHLKVSSPLRSQRDRTAAVVALSSAHNNADSEMNDGEKTDGDQVEAGAAHSLAGAPPPREGPTEVPTSFLHQVLLRVCSDTGVRLAPSVHRQLQQQSRAGVPVQCFEFVAPDIEGLGARCRGGPRLHARECRARSGGEQGEEVRGHALCF